MTGSTMQKSTTVKRPQTGRRHSHNTPHANAHAQAGGKGPPQQIPPYAAQDRTEPSWTEPAASPFAAAAQGGPHPAYGEPRASPKRKVMRLLLMAGIFVVGAGAGLIGAWWINEPSVLRPEPVAGTSSVAPVVTVRKPVESQPVSKVRGINPSELPYDGAAPPETAADEQQAAPVEPVTAKRQAPRVAPSLAEKNVKPVPVPESSGASPIEPSRAESGSNLPAEDAGLTVPDRTLPQESALSVKAPDGTSETEAGKADTRTELPPTKPAAKAAVKPRDVREARNDDDGKLSTTPKRPAPAKSAKDREIERMRQQAEEELKKKSESGRLVSRSRGTSQSAQAQSRRQASTPDRTANTKENYIRASLARCERAPNIFRREQCKWRICGGTWGKNGCPYYPPHATNTY